MILIFLDTEFTGLDQPSPRLISLGMVAENGAEFYAELPQKDYLTSCDPWVWKNVLPLLKGGDCEMPLDVLRPRLGEWFDALGAVRIVTDSPEFDFELLRGVLDPWPANVARLPLRFDSTSLGISTQQALASIRDSYFSSTRPEHHALHDAHALRQMWLGAAMLPEMTEWLQKTGMQK